MPRTDSFSPPPLSDIFSKINLAIIYIYIYIFLLTQIFYFFLNSLAIVKSMKL